MRKTDIGGHDEKKKGANAAKTGFKDAPYMKNKLSAVSRVSLIFIGDGIR